LALLATALVLGMSIPRGGAQLTMGTVSVRIATFLLIAATACGAPVKVLIVDGQNNHAWQQTTPVLKKILEDTGKFTAAVASTPPKGGGDMSAFHPDFSAYALVVSNYNGEAWPADVNRAFENWVRQGGGFVCYHAADNAFSKWEKYQEIIAVGGWGGRQSGPDAPVARWRDGRMVLDTMEGHCGRHGARRPFVITMRNPEHPIAKGLPAVWMHAADELYNSLCGPARDLTILATAFSDPENRGTGEQEPMLMAIRYGQGRVFHTTLGHDVAAMQCVGFIVTLQRGAEWAATGRVTLPLPPDFPTATEVRLRREP
jgi:type 1 glutamine amidotransferase